MYHTQAIEFIEQNGKNEGTCTYTLYVPLGKHWGRPLTGDCSPPAPGIGGVKQPSAIERHPAIASIVSAARGDLVTVACVSLIPKAGFLTRGSLRLGQTWPQLRVEGPLSRPLDQAARRVATARDGAGRALHL